MAGIQGGVVEYIKPGDTFTCTVAAAQTVTGGQLVAFVSGQVLTVQHAGAASLAVAGMALHNAAAGEKVTVVRVGICYLKANGAIAAGDQVIAAAGGDVSTLAAAAGATATDINNARAVVGTAAEAITSTNRGRVLLRNL